MLDVKLANVGWSIEIISSTIHSTQNISYVHKIHRENFCKHPIPCMPSQSLPIIGMLFVVHYSAPWLNPCKENENTICGRASEDNQPIEHLFDTFPPLIRQDNITTTDRHKTLSILDESIII